MPHAVMEGWLCEQYRCLPSELDGEDVNRLFAGRDALAIYRAATTPQERWSADDQAIMVELMQMDWERQHGGG